MKTYKVIGGLLLTGAMALFIPYTVLTMIFEYPDILRQDAAVVLTKFYEGGSTLIWTWFAFAITGIPLLPAYIMLGQELENKTRWVKVATTVGVVGLIVQMAALLRWTFVVPVLADAYVQASDEATRAAAVMAFKTIHQFGGVLLGEHLGQLFTITWTALITYSFAKVKFMPQWINILGYVSAFIYLLAQAELFATVIPDLLYWDMAGFIGSSLWLLWMILIGIQLIRKKEKAEKV